MKFSWREGYYGRSRRCCSEGGGDVGGSGGSLKGAQRAIINEPLVRFVFRAALRGIIGRARNNSYWTTLCGRVTQSISVMATILLFMTRRRFGSCTPVRFVLYKMRVTSGKKKKGKKEKTAHGEY